MRANMDTKPSTWLKMGLNTSFDQTFEKLTSSSEDVINNALQLTPQIPVKNLNGTYSGGDTGRPEDQYAPVNPIAIANLVTNNKTARQFMGGANIDVWQCVNKKKNPLRFFGGGPNFDIDMLPGLTFRSSLYANLNTQNSINYRPDYSIGWDKNNLASMSDFNGVNTSYTLNELLHYVKQFGKHNIDLMASHEASEWTYKNNGANITTFITNDIIDVQAGDPTTATISGGHGSGAMESYLGRLNYNYGEKYLI